MQYNFLCLDCEKEFDIYAKIGTLIIKDVICPECKSKNIKRKWFPISVHYHAEGFSKENQKED